ncbi:hypothetical protein WKI71_31025 [Streptomyces sp. MS1.AVA.1]
MLHLVSEDGRVLNEHPAGHGNSKHWYEFAVVEAHRSPRIERRPHGQYAVQRSREGGAVLRTKGAGRTALTTGGQVQLTDTLSLALGEDTRPGRSNRRRPPAAGATVGAGSSTGPGDSGNDSPFTSYL